MPACQNQSAPTSFAQASPGGTRQCTQSTDARCSTQFLTSIFSPFSSVAAAYCNDLFLVVVHYNSPSTFSTMLGGHNLDMMNSVIYPPQGGTGNVCATRQGSFTCTTSTVTKFPLNFSLLPSDSGTNNANTLVFGPGSYAGAQDGAGGWIVTNSLAPGSSNTTQSSWVGLPSRGATGVAINGQAIYPQYNNVGYRDVEQCNLNACGEHSGGGGGLPHYHLDGFHAQGICLYGPANYSTTTVHPPLIGFAMDGGWIYGRHLYATSEGSTVPLDNCGGHNHSSAVSYVNGVYHYHSQVLNATGTGGPRNAGGWGSAGTQFTYSTMGPANCWRGNASAIPNFMAGPGDTYTQACAGSSAYYFNANAGQSTFTANWTKSTCGPSTTASSPPPSPPPSNAGSVSPAASPPPPSPPPATTALPFSMTLNNMTTTQFVGTVRTAFINTLATTLNVAATAINVTGVSAATGNGRHLLQNSITVAFTVTTAAASSSSITQAVTNISSGTSATTFTALLVAAGVPTSGVALASAPTPTPAGTPSSGASAIKIVATTVAATATAMLF